MDINDNPLSYESMLLSQSWSLPWNTSTYEPISPCYPVPNRDAMDVATSSALSWQANYDFTQADYQVYLGYDPQSLSYIGNGFNVDGTQYAFDALLEPLTQYYWKVKAVVGITEIWSGVWSFTTGETVSEFAGGSGTEADPYLVATAEHLNNVRNYLTSHFKQTDDINLGVEPWTLNEGWAPIGSSFPYFQGAYDGDGHTITGLSIYRHYYNFQGLFGNCSSATLKNLTLSNLNIYGYGYVGGLVGNATNSVTVDNCHSSGSVTGIYERSGGLVGHYSDSSISNSHSSVVVIGVRNTGGLAGYTENATLSNCYSTGSVTGSSFYTGGLVGNAVLSSISNCFSSSAVSGNSYVGGLVGYLYSNSNISNSYSFGSVTGSNSGGLVGYNSTSTVTLSYWDTQTSGQAASAGGDGRTTDEMTYPFAANTYVGWDWTEIWAGDIDNSINSGYPYLQWQDSAQQLYPPQNLLAEVLQNELMLSWQASLAGLEQGYNIWRLETGQETNESSWEVLGSGLTELNYMDSSWSDLPDGVYKWAVKAAYAGSQFSEATFSNQLEKLPNLIPDDNFRMAINEALGQATDYQPTVPDLESLTGTLSADSREIVSIEGAQYLTNLDVLFLDGNQIQDISPLSNLFSLQQLYIGYNQISQLQPLSSLQALQHLYLYNNQISDINALNTMTGLVELYLNNNQISDISALENLTNLQWLYLNTNQINNISLLANLTEMHYLNLSYNQISEISSLSYLTLMQSLILNSNQVSDLSPLANLTNLIELELAGNSIIDISALSNLLSLQTLFLDINQISDISPLAGLTALESLYIDDNPLSYESMLHTQSWSLPYTASSYEPIAPCYPVPNRDASDVDPSSALSWQANYDYAQADYQVYLGYDPQSLSYIGNGYYVDGTEYAFDALLEPLTQYYWKVKAVAGITEIWSGMWSYTTGTQQIEPIDLAVESFSGPHYLAGDILLNTPLVFIMPAALKRMIIR